MPHNYFDERIAKEYDVRWAELFDPAVVDPAVDFLAGLAAAGGALELGIGTGRIALPLSRRGIRVHQTWSPNYRRNRVRTPST